MNKPQHPPAWADRLLESFCAPHLLEEVQGDLQELYGKWVEKHGVRKARWQYIIHVIRFLRPYAFKRITFYKLAFYLFPINDRYKKVYSDFPYSVRNALAGLARAARRA